MGRPRAGFAPVLYRFLLAAALPVDLKGRYLDEMVVVFRELHRDAKARGLGAVLGVWWRAVTQVVGGGFRDRFRRGRGKDGRQPQHRKATMMLDHLVQDLRFAYRSFLRQPWFSLTAIGIVALGIGATTAIFSMVDGIVLRKLPYPEPDRLVYFDRGSHTLPDYKDWLEQLPAFESIAAFWPAQRTIHGQGPPQQVVVGQTTANLFPLFGASPALGRLLTRQDMTANAPVAVLDHEFWMRRFGGDSSVMGRSLQIDGSPYEVVGVTPAGFEVVRRMAAGVAVWTPLDLEDAELQNRNLYIFRVAGRLADGASLELARSQMTAWEEAAAEAFPDSHVGSDGSIRRVPLVPLLDAETVDVRGPLFMLLGAVGLMLLIACANVANLLLARGADRERELAVRTALGGSRGRIGMQLLTESLALALTGAVAGLGVARLLLSGLVALVPADVPRVQDVTLDLRVLAFAMATAVVTGVVFGLAPAVYAIRIDMNEALKEASGKSSAGRGRLRLKGGLVVAEIALAMILLVGAGLLFNSFIRLSRVDPGFDPENVVAVPLTFGSFVGLDQAEGGARFQEVRDIMDAVAALPGVESVAVGAVVPFSEFGRCCMMSSAKTVSGEDSVRVVLHPVTPELFSTLRMPLVAGRDLAWRDAGAADNPVVITQTLAERFFGDGNPLGETFVIGRRQPESYTVVGLVGEPKFWNLSRDADVDVFFPYDTTIAGSLPFVHLAVRTAGSLDGFADAVRRVVWDLDPDMPIPAVHYLPARISETMTEERVLSTLLLVFAAFAITLAAAGIYGTMLYAVSQRSREFGIRMALGADAPSIVAHVLKRGAALTGLGVMLGLAGAVAVSRVLESLVFGIGAQDVPTYGAVAVLLTFVALAACYVPARRASRLDPMVTLRAE